MAIYAIGDVQGCFEPLERLLAELKFDRRVDELWFCGDLVNRGPQSLEVLRFVHDLGDRAVTVLGNHDLHLLAIALGGHEQKTGDTLDATLGAADSGALIDWLRHRPLVHRAHGYTLVHAGIAQAWNCAEALLRGQELETVLRGANHAEFFAEMYGNRPRRWKAHSDGIKRLRFITNVLTRMRYCTRDGALDFKEKLPPGEQAADLVPWFELPSRASAGEAIIFGHWATLQLHRPVAPELGLVHLDSGCLWGRELSAFRLDDEQMFSVSCNGC
ncbi:MAG: symmetrical bis(5'-nucleosyl)-tetraphosphatase [Chromatiales bacterium]|jgi:bis(5'-nucleosyl)-tetraphosphatase (symmetrical)|nr:symmetrical bis(5'-nucleosyl)-tetraphosphatase [Chromatiales bacterium]